ncbi:hypothetical protein RDI58_009918 [Solanum bulbocastanum]|uniref:Uncharacterized protein n=1 Tax=Solanum bulbocastanum TaxID=147425 RepID=A0AAN8TT00_SOLBU
MKVYICITFFLRNIYLI